MMTEGNVEKGTVQFGAGPIGSILGCLIEAEAYLFKIVVEAVMETVQRVKYDENAYSTGATAETSVRYYNITAEWQRNDSASSEEATLTRSVPIGRISANRYVQFQNRVTGLLGFAAADIISDYDNRAQSKETSDAVYDGDYESGKILRRHSLEMFQRWLVDCLEISINHMLPIMEMSGSSKSAMRFRNRYDFYAGSKQQTRRNYFTAEPNLEPIPEDLAGPEIMAKAQEIVDAMVDNSELNPGDTVPESPQHKDA